MPTHDDRDHDRDDPDDGTVDFVINDDLPEGILQIDENAVIPLDDGDDLATADIEGMLIARRLARALASKVGMS